MDSALAWMFATQGLGQGLSSAAQASGNAADRAQRQREMEQQWQRGLLNDAALREAQLRETATTEGGRDPFRDISSQGDLLQRLAIQRDSRLTPYSVSVPSEMQRFVPQTSGGFSYTPSPEHLRNLNALYGATAAGKTAPTMTNPANYGKTGAINTATGDYASGTPSPYDPGAFGPSYNDTLNRLESERNGATDDEDGGPGMLSTIAKTALGVVPPLLMTKEGGRLTNAVRNKLGGGPSKPTTTPGPGFDQSELETDDPTQDAPFPFDISDPNINWYFDPTDGRLKVVQKDGRIITYPVRNYYPGSTPPSKPGAATTPTTSTTSSPTPSGYGGYPAPMIPGGGGLQAPNDVTFQATLDALKRRRRL